MLAQTTSGAGAEAKVDAPEVATRAKVRSMRETADGTLRVHLKLLAKSKIPITTQTFRVNDRRLMAGIDAGDSVKFTTRRVDGENVLPSIRAVPECVRFQKCD